MMVRSPGIEGLDVVDPHSGYEFRRLLGPGKCNKSARNE